MPQCGSNTVWHLHRGKVGAGIFMWDSLAPKLCLKPWNWMEYFRKIGVNRKENNYKTWSLLHSVHLLKFRKKRAKKTDEEGALREVRSA